MTDIREVALLEVGIDNRVSEGAAAAARDLEKVEAAAEKAQQANRELEDGLRVVGRGFDSLSARVDATARAEQQRQAITSRAERQMAAITAAARAEGKSEEDLAAALQAVARARDADIAKAEQQARARVAQQKALLDGTRAVDDATRRANYQMAQLSPQLNDIATQLAMGQSPFMVLAAQGGQITQIFGGVRGTLAAAAAALGPVGIGVAAVAAPLALVFGAFNAQQSRLADLRSSLRATSEDYQALAAEVDEAAKRISRSGIGVSRSDAAGVMARLRGAAPEGSSFNFEALTRDAANFARVMGTDVAQASETFARAMRDPAAVVKELGERNFPGMTEALRLTVERLVQGGEKADAFDLVMRRVQDATRGAAQDVGPMTTATRDLGSALGTLWSSITEGLAGPGAALTGWLAGVVGWMNRAIERAQTNPVPEAMADDPTGFTPSVSMLRMNQHAQQFAQRVRQLENGGGYGGQNQLGYAGAYQFGTAALADLGVYSPRQGESVRSNAFVGTFNIPNMPGVRTLDDFLNSREAQDAVMRLRIAVLDRAIDALGPAANGLDRDALRYVAHGAGPAGMQAWVRSGGTVGNPDGNGLGPGDLYRRYSGAPASFGGVYGPVAGGTINLPPMTVDARPVNDLLERALKIARGEEGRPSGLMSVESTRGLLGSNVDTLQRASRLPGLAAAEQEAITRGLEAQRAAYEGTLTAAERMTRTEQERAGVLRQLDPVQRELAQAVQQYREAQRAAGRDADPAEEARIQAEVLERLRAEYAGVTEAANRQAESAERVAAAYGEGAEAGRRQELQERAAEAVRRSGIQGAAARRLAEDDLTAALNRGAKAEAEKALNQRNNQSRNELEYLQREAELIGASADARERELAALRARQGAGAAAGTPAAAEAERLAARLVDLRRNNDWLRNSWNDLASIGENAFSKIGDAITQAFATGRIETVKFKDVAKAALSEVVQAVLRLGVINPALNSLFGGTRGTLGGIMGVAGNRSLSGLGNLGLGVPGQLVLSADGSWAAAGSQAQQSLGVSAVGRLTGLSGITSYGGLANTGWSGVDGFLNTTFNPAASATNVGPGVGAAGSDIASAAYDTAGGLTYGNALAGGASIIGGAYSIYSGIQRGGVGGTVSALGGAAGMVGGASTMGLLGSTGWLASLGPYGMIAAAVLAIVGALLPGQKPSGKGQEFRYDLASGEVERNGLRSNGRYSAENASQAEAATMQIAGLASQISERLGGMRIGGNIAVGVTSSRGDGPGTLYLDIVGNKAQFSNDEAGAKELADRAAELILNEFRKTATGDYGGILRASPTVEALDQNLAWYEQVYKSFSQTGEAASAFAQGLAQVDTRFTELVNKANELSLSSNDLLSAWQKEKDRMTAERDLQVRGFDIGLDIRSLQARGANDNELLQQATLMQFDWAARQQIEQAKATLESWGLSAEDVASRIARNEVVLAEERLRIQQEYAERAAAIAAQLGEAQGQALQKTAAEMAAARQQAAQSGLSVVTSLRSYIAGLSTGPESPGTAMDRLAAAGRQFDAIFGAAYAGDANSISGFQGAAETYRSAARDVFGGGQGYADAIAKIADRSSSIVGLGAEGITQAFLKLENDRVVDGIAALQSAIDALVAENARLRADLNQILTSPGFGRAA